MANVLDFKAPFFLLIQKIYRSLGLTLVLLSLFVTVTLSKLFYTMISLGQKTSVDLSSLMRWHCKHMLRVLNVYVVRDPYLNIQNNVPTLYLANHVSYLDILVLGSQFKTGFLAKSEVSTWPFVGFVARSIGTIFVKRNSLFSKAMCIEKICERLEAGRSMVVFPEGTTSVDGPRKKFRPFSIGSITAAKWAGAQLNLVYLDYQDPHDIAWLGEDALLPNLWSLLGRPSTKVRLRESLLKPSQRGQSLEYKSSPAQMRLWLAESGFNTFL